MPQRLGEKIFGVLSSLLRTHIQLFNAVQVYSNDRSLISPPNNLILKSYC